jgi:hypothetical protein
MPRAKELLKGTGAIDIAAAGESAGAKSDPPTRRLIPPIARHRKRAGRVLPAPNCYCFSEVRMAFRFAFAAS